MIPGIRIGVEEGGRVVPGPDALVVVADEVVGQKPPYTIIGIGDAALDVVVVPADVGEV